MIEGKMEKTQKQTTTTTTITTTTITTITILKPTLDDIGGAHELAAVHLLGVLQHGLCALLQVAHTQRAQVDAQLCRRDLLQQVRVCLRVLDVAAKVADAQAAAALAQVVVDPAQQQLLFNFVLKEKLI